MGYRWPLADWDKDPKKAEDAFSEILKGRPSEHIRAICQICDKFSTTGAEDLHIGILGAKLPQYWGAVKSSEIAPDIRPACMGCEYFVPYNADMTVALIGNQDIDKQCTIFLNTDKGEQSADSFAGELTEGEVESEIIDGLRSKRQAKKQELLDGFGIEGFDIQRVFEKCIGCRNCSKVCPVCYCRVCFFDSGGDEHDPHYYETELGKRGYVPVLPAPIFYQLVRLFHVSISCVGCGLCGDVCPVNIPLWAKLE